MGAARTELQRARRRPSQPRGSTGSTPGSARVQARLAPGGSARCDRRTGLKRTPGPAARPASARAGFEVLWRLPITNRVSGTRKSSAQRRAGKPIEVMVVCRAELLLLGLERLLAQASDIKAFTYSAIPKEAPALHRGSPFGHGRGGSPLAPRVALL